VSDYPQIQCWCNGFTLGQPCFCGTYDDKVELPIVRDCDPAYQKDDVDADDQK
jgi:hypothetical protein